MVLIENPKDGREDLHLPIRAPTKDSTKMGQPKGEMERKNDGDDQVVERKLFHGSELDLVE